MRPLVETLKSSNQIFTVLAVFTPKRVTSDEAHRLGIGYSQGRIRKVLVGGNAVLNWVECELNAKMINPKKSVKKPFLENVSM